MLPDNLDEMTEKKTAKTQPAKKAKYLKMPVVPSSVSEVQLPQISEPKLNQQLLPTTKEKRLVKTKSKDQ